MPRGHACLMDLRKTLGLLVALALGGCVAPVRVTNVTGPDGQPAIVLSCHHEERCYQKAGELCPGGYATLNEHSGFAIAPAVNNVYSPVRFSGPMGSSRDTLMIQCRG